MDNGPISRAELFSRLRRSCTRYKFQVDAEVVMQSRRTWGRVRNISRNGMFLEIENPPRMNSRFVVRLAFDTPLFLACVVRRLVPGVGVGVSLSVPARMRRRFDGLMQALASGGDSAGHGAEMPPPPAPHKVRAMAAGM